MASTWWARTQTGASLQSFEGQWCESDMQMQMDQLNGKISAASTALLQGADQVLDKVKAGL